MSSPVKSLSPRVDADDEALAVQCHVPVLISGEPDGAVAQVAGRIHRAKFGSMDGFAHTKAAGFPDETDALIQHCSRLMEAAKDVTIFIADVEQLPAAVQTILLQSLAESKATGHSGGTVRLIAGTTVSLWDRVLRGTFSESLFYRLNTIHLTVDRD